MAEPIIDQTVDKKIDVKIEEAQLPVTVSLDTAENIASKTTIEQDLETAGQREARTLKTSGQRKVNLIWEITQALIAIAITGSVIYAELKEMSSTILGNAFTLIIAIYFVRMNHIKVGGVGGTDSADTR